MGPERRRQWPLACRGCAAAARCWLSWHMHPCHLAWPASQVDPRRVLQPSPAWRVLERCQRPDSYHSVMSKGRPEEPAAGLRGWRQQLGLGTQARWAGQSSLGRLLPAPVASSAPQATQRVSSAGACQRTPVGGLQLLLQGRGGRGGHGGLPCQVGVEVPAVVAGGGRGRGHRNVLRCHLEQQGLLNVPTGAGCSKQALPGHLCCAQTWEVTPAEPARPHPSTRRNLHSMPSCRQGSLAQHTKAQAWQPPSELHHTCCAFEGTKTSISSLPLQDPPPASSPPDCAVLCCCCFRCQHMPLPMPAASPLAPPSQPSQWPRAATAPQSLSSPCRAWTRTARGAGVECRLAGQRWPLDAHRSAGRRPAWQSPAQPPSFAEVGGGRGTPGDRGPPGERGPDSRSEKEATHLEMAMQDDSVRGCGWLRDRADGHLAPHKLCCDCSTAQRSWAALGW